MSLSAHIGKYIAEQNPRVRYYSSDIEKAMAEYTEVELSEMREIGLLGSDFETYYVIREFLRESGVLELTGGDYLLPLFQNARKLDAVEFRENPYIKAVTFPDARSGNVFLTTAEYRRGEILQYDMPDFSHSLVVPKLGFFDRTVRFPTIYENNTPWMSVCPSEIESMKDAIAAAHGKALVLGLGLGYYPFMIAEKPDVSEITIVELNERIIGIFEKHILPQFPHRDKIRVVHGDAVAYLAETPCGAYDFCFADIWEGAVDGAEPYRKIRKEAARLCSTEFRYWIEPQIKAYIENAEC